MEHFGDITQLDGHTLPAVDVVTGGSPCQDLSVAGLRAGLAGERSGLFLEQIRIVKEMRESDGISKKLHGGGSADIRPRYMVWENVQGALSSNGGRDFQRVLTEIVRIACPEAPDVPMPEGGVESGPRQDASSMRWEPGQLPGGSTMLNTGESPSEENESHLSQILMGGVPQKYSLSAKACQGILNRAAKRNRILPEVLRMALETQAAM